MQLLNCDLGGKVLLFSRRLPRYKDALSSIEFNSYKQKQLNDSK